MIDTDKYEGHTEGNWEYDGATIHATAKGGNEIIAEYPCWNYNKDQLITKEEEANLRLMADAPLLLEEVKRLREEKRLVELEHGIGLDHREAQVTIRLNRHYEKQHEKLLAEVKRLRERLIRAYDWAENAVNGNDSAMMDYTEYVCGGEEE